MKYLITGGCGFLGTNLASQAIGRGEELIVLDNLSRLGAEKNLQWLRAQGDFQYFHGDVRIQGDVEKIISRTMPDIVFHLAGQVAMTTSVESPRFDFETNALGSLNILEAVRKYRPDAPVLYSSTNKVYGDLEWADISESESRYIAKKFPKGFPENIPLDFHSPYGCSKGAADQYMQDYHRMFGLKTVVFRHSSMYGGRQFASFDQGWIGWFCQKAFEKKEGKSKEAFTISGSGKQVRDVLYADDMVSLYFSAANQIDKAEGQIFNIGGGMRNSLSLIELFSFLENELRIELSYTRLPPRQSDQRVFVADYSKATKLLGWTPTISKGEGIRRMLSWISERV
ncbi:MAG TPA: GDP-mannose 4,6-dehydratase [Dehalococcoidia bacterium]|nr:GDP-mannose 4,6-dehydratase [Dehalococcoidia bacterium]